MKKIILLSLLTTLIWTIACKKEDVKTCAAPPTVSVGDDITLTGQTSVVLNGVSSEKDGTWTILEGIGGSFVTEGGSVKFTGIQDNTYKLKWESKNDCGISSDTLDIALFKACGTTKNINEMVENIEWIQQACFKIKASPLTIYTDPNSIKTNDVADIILISHPHGDHYSDAEIAKIAGPKTILIAPQEVDYKGTIGKRVILRPDQQYTAFGCVTIKAVPAYNINKTSFHPKSNRWVGYLITTNGVTIYHAGDTERVPEMKTFTCDIAMLPLGQTYTFDTVSDAIEAAKDVKAKLAIPMHFGLYEGTSDDALAFKKGLDGIIPVVIKEKK